MLASISTTYHADNPIQMTKICPTCTSVCDLCRNGFFWRQDSSLGLVDVNIIGGRNWRETEEKSRM